MTKEPMMMLETTNAVIRTLRRAGRKEPSMRAVWIKKNLDRPNPATSMAAIL
jgi:hypothetical protein